MATLQAIMQVTDRAFAGEVDLTLLGRWLEESGVAKGEVRNPVRRAGGAQNLLLHFTCGGEELVLRRPPPDRKNARETVRRESIVLDALATSGVPHPRLRATCMDDTVAGGAFLVVNAVRGFNATIQMPGVAAT